MSNSDLNIQRVLGIFKNKVSINEDNFVRLDLTNTSRLVEPDKNVFIVNNIDKFNQERNESGCYRISGKLEIMTNNEISQAWATLPEGSDWDPKILDPNLITKNWVLQITYPFTANSDTQIYSIKDDGTNFSSKASRGVQINEMLPFKPINGDEQKVLLRTLQNHGVNFTGEYIYLTVETGGIIEYLGFHKVIDFEFGNEDKGLILDTTYIGPSNLGNVKRVFEPSVLDVTFNTPFNITQISKCDSTGGFTGILDHTKIYDINHGVKINEFIDLRFNNLTTLNNLNGLYKVVAVPNSDEFVIKYDLQSAPTNLVTINLPTTLNYRVVDGTPSEYYVRKFKILTELSDYEIYKAGYSKNIFSDDFSSEVNLFHFNKTINVNDLTDNLGRPLTELYFTITKRSYPWGDVSTMFENNSSVAPMVSTINLETVSFWDSSGYGTIQRQKPFLDPQNQFFGDFSEFNSAFLDEKTLARTIHRFGVSKVNVPYLNPNGYSSDGEGYYYYPHNKIQIRKFSNVIETVPNEQNQIYPDYAQINNDNTVSWRDLLDIGFFEEGINGVDYPFVNGCNYLYDNYTIYIRRQKPVKLTDIKVKEADFVKINPDEFNQVGSKC